MANMGATITKSLSEVGQPSEVDGLFVDMGSHAEVACGAIDSAQESLVGYVRIVRYLA